MPGLWKPWKAKSRLPTLSTSPLEISPKTQRDSHIPPAPTTMLSLKTKKHQRAGYRPPPAAAFNAASGVIVVDREKYCRSPEKVVDAGQSLICRERPLMIAAVFTIV